MAFAFLCNKRCAKAGPCSCSWRSIPLDQRGLVSFSSVGAIQSNRTVLKLYPRIMAVFSWPTQKLKKSGRGGEIASATPRPSGLSLAFQSRFQRQTPSGVLRMSNFNNPRNLRNLWIKRVVGAERFELPTYWSQTSRATRLRYAPFSKT